MKTEAEIRDALRCATGTSQYHKWSFIPGAPKATDGVVALAEDAEAWWLLDAIVSHQGNPGLDPAFQVWTLVVAPDNTATLQGCNDVTPVVTQEIEYTDFPLFSIELYVINGVILLPSEY
jgi:hypothetical protein